MIPKRLDKVREGLRRGELPPAGSFTIAEYGERYGLGYSAARRQLEEMVKAGRLCRGVAVLNTVLANVYWIAE